MFELFNGGVTVADSATFNPAVAAQDLVTYGMPENFYDFVLVIATITVDSSATAQVQTLNFDIIDGVTTIKTIPFKTIARLDFTPITIFFPVRKNTKGNLKISLRGGTIDAQTAIIVKDFMVVGID